MPIVLASNNKGKLKEFKALFEPLGYEIVPQGALGVKEADEPFDTFLENALAKARNASRQTGLPAIADDSGICVDALGGEPGVHSARFSGEGATDEKNNSLLIHKLSGETNRKAHYTCCLVGVRSEKDPEPLVVFGHWYGKVLDEPRGSNGFGYDPYFLIPHLGKTAAELSSAEKNAISHRGVAMERLKECLLNFWAK